MKRFLIFPAVFPPLAFVVLTAPGGFEMILDWIVSVYAIAVLPALLLAWIDWGLSAKPTRVRVMGTAATAALAAVLITCFLYRGWDELRPFLMAGLVGGVPAAVCSWLST